MPQCFYDLLAVDKNATEDEIKKAYRKKALKCHPDKGGTEEEFKKVGEAYQVLSDKRQRQIYDQRGHAGLQQGGGGGGGGHGFHGGIDPHDIFRAFFEQGGMQGGPGVRFHAGGPGVQTFTFGGMNGMNAGGFGGDGMDPFQQMFMGGMGGGGGPRVQALALTLEEVFKGGDVKRQIGGKQCGIPIEKGVHTGTEMTLDVDGQTVKVRLQMQAHHTFTREGPESANLNMKLVVPLLDILMGGIVKTKDIAGEDLKLEIPPMSRGVPLVVRNKGLPYQGMDTTRGDLVVVPVLIEPEIWSQVVGWIRMGLMAVMFMYMFSNPAMFFIGVMILPKILKAIE